MKLHTSKCLYEYWNELRGENIAPKRKDLDPMALKNILPNLFLLDMISSDNYNFRLAGTKTCNIFGAELTGHNFLELWNADDKDSFVSLLDTLTEQGVGIVCGLKGEAEDVKVTLEFLALPLVDTQTELCTSVIGSFGFKSDIERSIKLPISNIEMISLRVIWPIDEQVPSYKTVSSKKSVLQLAIAEETHDDNWSRRAKFEVIQGGRF